MHDPLEIWDLQHPMRIDVDDPMWIPDRIDVAKMSGALELEPAEVGSIFPKIAHAVTAPARAVVNVATTAIETPFNVAARVLETPFNIANRLANKLPGGGGGGGGGAPAPAPDPGPDPSADPSMSVDPGDGGGDVTMQLNGNWMHPSQGHHHRRRHPAAMTGFGLPSLPDWHPLKFLEDHNPFKSSTPAGELLVSAVPGGVAAKEAHAIATKALKDGTLKPAHLKKAGDLARAARSGHKGSVAKIANIKHQAGKGNPHAEVALDRLKLADTLQRGGTVKQSTTSLRHLRRVGLATLKA